VTEKNLSTVVDDDFAGSWNFDTRQRFWHQMFYGDADRLIAANLVPQVQVASLYRQALHKRKSKQDMAPYEFPASFGFHRRPGKSEYRFWGA
jgi:hypothetical protein